LDWLLDHSADIEAEVPASKERALHFATKMKHQDCAKKLLAKGANPNAIMHYGYRALHIVSSGQCADSSLVEELLEKGADIEATDDEGATAFHYAARDNLFEVVEVLLNHQANFGAKNGTGNTPLHLAAQNGHYEVCQTIIEKNPKLVDFASKLGGNTPLHEAASRGHTDIIELLIEFKANIEQTNIQGLTPLHISVARSQDKAFRALIKAGANINALSHNLENVLHAAALNQSKMSFMFYNKNVFDKIKPLIDGKDRSGLTPLHIAASMGHPEAAELLIKHGANIEALEMDERTPLNLAAYTNQAKVVEILLHKGANKEAKDSINLAAPLHYASLFGYLEVVKLLVESGARLEEKDETGLTPLACAAMKQRSFVVEYLLSKGANPKSKDDESLTPFHRAAIKGDLTIMKLLVGKCSEGLDLEDMDRRTPLDCAKDFFHWEVAKYIEEHKVKILIQNYYKLLIT
jgi:ankyrin repeat protein